MNFKNLALTKWLRSPGYRFSEIKNSVIWDNLVSTYDQSKIYQLWCFGTITERVWHSSVKRILVTYKDEPTLIIQLAKAKLPDGRYYLTSYGGPIIVNNYYDSLGILISGLKQSGGFIQGVNFLKIEPRWRHSVYLKSVLSAHGFRESHDFWNLNSEGYINLNLAQNTDALWRQMNQTTRRHIKKALNKGAVVRKASSEADFETFWNLHEKTSKRKKFLIQSREWYRGIYKLNFYKSIGQPFSELLLLDYKNKTEAAALFIYHKETVDYCAGGSLIDPDISGLKLVLWQAIKEAKTCGCVNFDLRGFNSNKMAGLAQFKRGFGGEEIKQIGVFDYIFK